MLIALLSGCGSGDNTEDSDAGESLPDDPITQMTIAFNGSPSSEEIQEGLDNAFAAVDFEVTDENYSRAGSVLVALRKEFGINEMEILRCIPSIVTDPRLPSISFSNAAAVCNVDLVQGK